MTVHSTLRSLATTIAAAAFVIAMLPTQALNPQPLPPSNDDLSLLSDI